jgi:hypothetical protein
MTLRIVTLVAITATIAILLIVVPTVKAWANSSDPPTGEQLKLYLRAIKDLSSPTFEEQLQVFDQTTFLMLERQEQQQEQQQQNTTTITEDDGYTYPKNATDEEKAAIDALEHQAWVNAGRPGAQPQPQPQPQRPTMAPQESCSQTFFRQSYFAAFLLELYSSYHTEHKLTFL